MFLTITLCFIFLDILTHDISKEKDIVFDMNSLALIFSERHLNYYFDVLFFPWCFDVTFKFHNSVLIQVLIS